MNNLKKILVLGLVDSIHVARWLEQFKDCNVEFYIYPSHKFKLINPELKKLISTKNVARYIIISPLRAKIFYGYLDYLFFEFFSKIFPQACRTNHLKKVLKIHKFQYVHAIEIQSAGYLIKDMSLKLLSDSKIIVTNYGSDIYYFMQYPEHEMKIRKVLEIAQYYSAECFRDYKLARDLGFTGVELPCIPNAGGFNLPSTSQEISLPSNRNQIIIKGYGGELGRADIPVNLIELIALEFPQINFFIYSATNDILELIERFPTKIKQRVTVAKIRDRLPNNQIMNEFKKSRLYVGSSKSDGISTSFLQAILTGAYPIQTNTSCASEWIARGVQASIVDVDSSIIYREIRVALTNDSLVDQALHKNLKIAKEYLDYEVIRQQSLQFYGLIE